MYPNTLDQLGPEQRAVIAWFYSLSSPPSKPEAFPEQARQGLSCFLRYVASTAAHEPGMLSPLLRRSYEEIVAIYGTENALFRHAIEVVTQKVLLDEAHDPETHRYTTPLFWPPSPEGEPPTEMPRMTLYIHAIFLLFSGIEEVREELSRTWAQVQGDLKSAIRRHCARRGKQRGRTS